MIEALGQVDQGKAIFGDDPMQPPDADAGLKPVLGKVLLFVYGLEERRQLG